MLCTGAEMKNTFCLVRGNQAVLSQHFGDLSDEGGRGAVAQRALDDAGHLRLSA